MEVLGLFVGECEAGKPHWDGGKVLKGNDGPGFGDGYG